jgi:hypothetical protein
VGVGVVWVWGAEEQEEKESKQKAMNTNKEGNKKVTNNRQKISQKEHTKIRTQKQDEDKEETKISYS